MRRRASEGRLEASGPVIAVDILTSLAAARGERKRRKGRGFNPACGDLEVLHAPTEEELLRHGRAACAQDPRAAPRAPAGTAERRLLRELDRLVLRDDHDIHGRRLLGLGRPTDRVVIVPEDQSRVQPRKAEFAAQGNRRATVVARAARNRRRRKGRDHEVARHSEEPPRPSEESLDASAEEGPRGDRVPVRVEPLQEDERVSARPSVHRLLRDRHALAFGDEDGRGRRRLRVRVCPFLVVLEDQLDPEAAQGDLTGQGDLRTRGVLAARCGRGSLHMRRHRNRSAYGLSDQRRAVAGDRRPRVSREHSARAQGGEGEGHSNQAHDGQSLVDVVNLLAASQCLIVLNRHVTRTDTCVRCCAFSWKFSMCVLTTRRASGRSTRDVLKSEKMQNRQPGASPHNAYTHHLRSAQPRWVRGVAWSILGGSGPLDSGSNPDGPIPFRVHKVFPSRRPCALRMPQRAHTRAEHASHKGWKRLLADPAVRRWYENLARGSDITAVENARVLNRYLAAHRLTPNQLVVLATKDRRAVEDQLQDFMGRLGAEEKGPGYILNHAKAVKSFLDFHEVRLVRKFKVRHADATPTLDEERVPNKEELKSILSSATTRGRVVLSFMGLSGVRPQVL